MADGASTDRAVAISRATSTTPAEFALMKGKMLRARKAMVPDDEITCDYGSDYFDLFIAPIGCRCATCAATR
jgi:hypothetical protein